MPGDQLTVLFPGVTVLPAEGEENSIAGGQLKVSKRLSSGSVVQVPLQPECNQVNDLQSSDNAMDNRG
jgi:hypothetical protein